MIFFQVWILCWFLTVFFIGLISNRRMYRPEWSKKSYYHSLNYQLMILITSPLSWIYLFFKELKGYSSDEESI